MSVRTAREGMEPVELPFEYVPVENARKVEAEPAAASPVIAPYVALAHDHATVLF